MIDGGYIRFMYMEEGENEMWVIIDERFEGIHI
jgi:hypothetical protein